LRDAARRKALNTSSSARPLRILAVVPGAFCFGLQNAELAVFGELSRRMQCHFLNTRWTDGEFDRRLDTLGIARSSTWLGMFSRKLDWRNLKMTAECLMKLPLAWRDFIRLYRSFRPDIVYVANHHDIILLLPLLIPIRRMVVCHIHDPPPAIPFQKVSAALWRRAVGRFLFVSDSARTRMAALVALTPEDAVIHNGVAVSCDAPPARSMRFCQQFGWPDDAVIFGITGQIGAHKGHDDFIEAAALIRDEAPHARFVIGGRGSAREVVRLAAAIRSRGLADTMRFCGWLPAAHDFYAAIDVLVLPSRHDEGFGLVVAEAGERGVPAVATRSGGAVEIVEDGVTGLLVAKQAPSELSAAMLRFAGDEAVRRDMGRRARLRVATNFNLTTQADRVAAWLAKRAVDATA
jgi:glycosyltransferase involved in cell wall biosynthesis